MDLGITVVGQGITGVGWWIYRGGVRNDKGGLGNYRIGLSKDKGGLRGVKGRVSAFHSPNPLLLM